MSKVAFLLPTDAMVDMANRIIEEEKAEDILFVKKIRTADSLHEARLAVKQGAGIIIARGVQAKYIKRYTNVPIVEICMSGQELGLLVVKAKKLSGKKKPKIALIGFGNMFSDTSYFDELFSVNLTVCPIEDLQQIPEYMERMMQDGVDVVIGGEEVLRQAQMLGIKSVFYESREDSIRDALNIAEKMRYSAAVEKKHIAQFETVLDASFNGIIKISSEKEITIVNRIVETMLEKKTEQLVGNSLGKAVPELDENLVQEVLDGKRETYITSVYIHGNALMVTTAPIQLEEEIVGAIISFHKLSNNVKRDGEMAREMYLRGYSSGYNFSQYHAKDKVMQKCIEKAKVYAISSSPILIYGESGTGKDIMAQCIHNNSAYKAGPFVSINCSGMSEEMQLTKLFGNAYEKDPALQRGALSVGNHGTVLISEVDALSPVCQYRLFRAIKYEDLIQNDIEKSQTLNNRIIVSAKNNLILSVKNGTFREDLFYLLNGLVLEIPPLRERKADIEYLVSKYCEKISRKYSKYMRISADAMQRMKEYEWPGNELQLESFCERLFLTTQKKTVGAEYVQFLLDELYPAVKVQNREEKMVVYKHPEAAKIAELLEKHAGNRAKVAEEMGMSTTTLWRHMKKYGVLNKYDV